MKINNIFEKIISNSKNCQNLMLIEEKKTYNDLYLNTKKIYEFLKKNLKKDEIICVCLNYSFDFVEEEIFNLLEIVSTRVICWLAPGNYMDFFIGS